MGTSPTNSSVLVLGYYVINNTIFIPLLRANNEKSVITKSNWALYTWRIPGRNVEIGETPIEAATSEYKKRVGFAFLSLTPIKVNTKKSKLTRRESHLQYWYVGNLDISSGFKNEIKRGKDSFCVRAFSLQEIQESIQAGTPLGGYTLLPTHKIMIMELCKRKTGIQ